MNYLDSGKFSFAKMKEGGHHIPVHHRDLGEKDGHLYSDKISWADVIINAVPLDKTFEYEDAIDLINDAIDHTTEKGVILVNDRNISCPVPSNVITNIDHQRAIRRLEKMNLNPITLPQAKKKKKNKYRWPVKPKDKRDIRIGKIMKSSDKFNELIDPKDQGVLADNIYSIKDKASGKWKMYCPPEHWLSPVIRWDLIWSEMDMIENGYKRSYHYTKPGEINKDGIPGPAIYFYDSDSTDLN